MKKRGMIAAAVLAGALGITACAAGTAGGTVTVETAKSHIINVNSSETVTAEPDIAQIELTVYSQAEDAKACQTKNSEDLQRVIEALTAQGIEESSIQTASFGLNPVYDWDSGKTVTGYEMSSRVTVRDIPIDNAGTVLKAVVEAGANQIDSVSYLCSTFDEKYQEALKMAIESAKIKAQAMAEAGGCQLGAVININELSSDQQPRYTKASNLMMEAEEAGLAADTGSIDVMGGEIEIEANVNVDFSIQ